MSVLALTGELWLRVTKRRPPVAAVDDVRGLVWAGACVIVGFFGLLGSWAALAPVAGAAIAPGVTKVEGHRQSVQHRFGGTVKQILVHDGDHVERGAVLMRLDDSGARAKVTSLTALRDSLKALEARLVAERDGAAAVTFDPTLISRLKEPTVASAIANQQALFRDRTQQFASEQAVLRQKIAQVREQIAGAQVQAESADRQRTLIHQELEDTRTLYEKGYSPKTKVLALERSESALVGEAGGHRAEIARAEQAIGETEISIEQAKEARLTDIANQLHDTQTKLAELTPQLEDARDELAHTELTAPASGDVVGMTVFTEGGVIAPGARVLDIVPSVGPPIVEARVRPEDIHDVSDAATAEIRMTGMVGRQRPALTGAVEVVSADRLEDSRTGVPYYSARIRVDPQSLRKSGIALQPGMPTEVLIATKSRTVLDYLLSPLRDQIARGLRED